MFGWSNQEGWDRHRLWHICGKTEMNRGIPEGKSQHGKPKKIKE